MVVKKSSPLKQESRKEIGAVSNAAAINHQHFKKL
jgi:hypothetical protein